MFDRTKYKVIIKFAYPDNYTEILDWVNSNTTGDVKVDYSIIPPGEMSAPWYTPAGLARAQTVYMGFEKEDDATFFKIKYPICQC